MDRSGSTATKRVVAASAATMAALAMLAGCSFKGWPTKVEVTEATGEDGYTYLQAKNVGQRLVADEHTVIANCDCDWTDLYQHVQAGKKYTLRWKSSGSGKDLHLDRIDVGEKAETANGQDADSGTGK